MKKIILILASMLTLAACTKEGDVIYQTDPADAPSAKPLVTVIYDPNAVGDGNYNDWATATTTTSSTRVWSRPPRSTACAPCTSRPLRAQRGWPTSRHCSSR